MNKERPTGAENPDGTDQSMDAKKSILWRRFGEGVRALGTLRDGLLVIAAAVYVLGYLVWSWNAWTNDLGLLPALDVQYFAAGVLPAFLLWSCYVAVKNAMGITRGLARWVRRPMQARGLRQLTLAIFAVGLAVLIYGTLILRSSVMWLGTGVMLTFVLMRARPEYTGKSWSARYYRFAAIYNPVFVGCFTGLLLYVSLLYPMLPQSLGGTKPRCVYLDVEKRELSNETLRALFPAESVGSQDQVIQSVKVDVYFWGRNFLRVKPHAAAKDAKQSVYEIRQGIIQAVSSCDQCRGESR